MSGVSVVLQKVLPQNRVLEVLEDLHGGSIRKSLGYQQDAGQSSAKVLLAEFVRCGDVVDSMMHMLQIKVRTQSRDEMQQYNFGAGLMSQALFQRLLWETKSYDGHRLLHEWPEVYSMADLGAITVVDELVYYLVTRFGVPLELHSDHGGRLFSVCFRSVQTGYTL